MTQDTKVYVSISLENKFDDPVLTPSFLGVNSASVAANTVSNENPFYLSRQECCLGQKSHIPRPQIPLSALPLRSNSFEADITEAMGNQNICQWFLFLLTITSTSATQIDGPGGAEVYAHTDHAGTVNISRCTFRRGTFHWVGCNLLQSPLGRCFCTKYGIPWN